jgi:Kef-type K+ transport system membrane component KefB
MLFAGVELQPRRLIQYSRGAFAVATCGMVLPMALGVGLGWAFLPASEAFFAQCLFLGTALAITAVPATVRILVDLGRLQSQSGQIIVSAAVFDDILSLILLAWLTAFLNGDPTTPQKMAQIGFSVIAFFAITIAAGIWLFPMAGRFMLRFKQQRELEFSALLAAALAFAVLAELVQLHFIVGAFMAGLFFGRKTIDEPSYDDVRSKTSAMTFGFLAPIFFASVGAHLDFEAVIAVPAFVVCLLVVAFLGKFVGAGAAARGVGLSNYQAAAVGAGMSARGAVELVIADIALEAGLFELPGASPVVEHMFSAIVIMAVLTTLVTPLLLKRIYAHIPP